MNLADRLFWAITELSSGEAGQLFKYMSQRSHGTIPPEDWEKMIHKVIEPSFKMVEVVCIAMPHLTEWIVTGTVYLTPKSIQPTYIQLATGIST